MEARLRAELASECSRGKTAEALLQRKLDEARRGAGDAEARVAALTSALEASKAALVGALAERRTSPSRSRRGGHRPVGTQHPHGELLPANACEDTPVSASTDAVVPWLPATPTPTNGDVAGAQLSTPAGAAATPYEDATSGGDEFGEEIVKWILSSNDEGAETAAEAAARREAMAEALAVQEQARLQSR